MNRQFAFFLLSLFMIYATVGMILAAFARLGLGVALFLGLLWFGYRRRAAVTASLRSLDPVAWIRNRRKERTYRRMRDVWRRVNEIRRDDMTCPGCRVEITIFTINLDGRCARCGGKLV